jgi:cytochrome c oxidase subunit 2
MIGSVIAMEPAAFQAWLAGGPEGGAAVPVVTAGEAVFQAQGCPSCHSGDSSARGPALAGLFGSTVRLRDGRAVVADDAYLRESIVRPQAKVVAGYEPLMPTYEGLIGEEDLMRLVAYVKSLTPSGASR